MEAGGEVPDAKKLRKMLGKVQQIKTANDGFVFCAGVTVESLRTACNTASRKIKSGDIKASDLDQ